MCRLSGRSLSYPRGGFSFSGCCAPVSVVWPQFVLPTRRLLLQLGALAALEGLHCCLNTASSYADVIKEQNRELRGTQRAIIRDRAALEKQEKQLELEIKKMAKIGNKEACRVLAKQLVHLRKQKTRTFAVSSKVTSMSTQTKVMNSQMKMAGAMSTTAKTMQAVNKKVDPQKTLQTMQNFQKENMKMEMTEEMINDTLDDIFDGSDEEEESQDIVNQVLDEIGIEISGKMAKAPSAARSLPSASTSKATISDEEIERQLKALGVD
nr:charged multivesicular body protein 2b isoform X2 [Equus caballus]